MIDYLLSYIAPHLCCGCGKLGVQLCDSCKYNIISEHFATCLMCGRLAGNNGTCFACRVPYERSWCVGERSGELYTLLNQYKFYNARAAYRPLAQLLHETVDHLPESVIVVPVPTIASHIRQRGYDHMWLVARHFARLRNLTLSPCLQRAATTRQLGASRSIRERQAQVAFKVTQKLSGTAPYLLVDDVVTTGATLKYATRQLHRAGAKKVWVAVIARQPID